MSAIRILLFAGLCVRGFLPGISQERSVLKDGKIMFWLDEEGGRYIRLAFLNQTWARYSETNPGSTLYGDPVGNIFDIGLRRTRLQLYGQLTKKVFFYTQFGQNNFSSLSNKYSGAFFHDALGEYEVFEKYLTIGGGLTGWSGLSRYASPSVGSMLTTDAPLYQQATNGINDQFLRKLSVYTKGKIGKIDYRVALTKPMAVQNAAVSIDPMSEVSNFSIMPAKLQTQGYFMFQFLDQESNITPYMTGSYLGGKKVFNLGAGFVFQPDAMARISVPSDTIVSNMALYGVDMFLDTPLNSEKGSAITCYIAYTYYNFGPGYLRNVGAMNPANGTTANATLNGAGNAFPMIGTGNAVYIQAGFLPSSTIGGAPGGLQPYISVFYADYLKPDDGILTYDAGINWFINGTHQNKLSFNYQNRPVFGNVASSNGGKVTDRKGIYLLQFQVSI